MRFVMAFAEALSDDGSLTGRGAPVLRGVVCGAMTAAGGLGHTLPYLIPDFFVATIVSVCVVAAELAIISFIRNRFSFPCSDLSSRGRGRSGVHCWHCDWQLIRWARLELMNKGPAGKRGPCGQAKPFQCLGVEVMEFRQLGRSGLKVSVLGLGTMTFGGKGAFAKTGSTDIEGARRQIDLCLDAGINLFDTADVYSAGLSEEILGQALKSRRDKVLVAAKVRFRTGDGPNDAGLSRIHLIKACEASLKRLGTDHIDLYQLHEWDGQTPLEETLEALDSLVQSGKVRYVGVYNFSGWHLMKTIGVSELVKLIRPVSQQIHYTLQAREAEYELVPISIDQGLGILIWSPLAGGLLSGKYRRGYKPPEGTRQLANWGEPPVQDQEKLYDIIELLVAIAEGRGISAAQVALAWLIGRPGVTSVVIGARTDAQLQDNLKAGGVVLTAEERARLDAASAPALLYPYWHQASTASDRLSPADLSLLGPHLKR
jgi:aryl-alcohol dehydrogenase-like predicted oxidoreductase